jgi:hypothetical protein
LDFVVILSDAHARRLIQAYVTFFNQARPHQGIDQQIPEPPFMDSLPETDHRRVVGVPILGGLHHDYRWVA